MMTIDWKNPNFSPIFAERAQRLVYLRQHPQLLPAVKAHYRDHPADFINDFGVTVDPRLVERNLPALVPFTLFPRQREWIEWIYAKWRAQEPGITEKSREVGVSWLAVAFACTMCLHHEGMMIGFGSRKEPYVDEAGSPKALFWKAREFMKYLPPEFANGWNEKTDAPHMRLRFRATNSFITGEAGDNIGRGDRASIYFVDEAAFLERPMLIDAALSATTNCRQDISSANGMGNPFAQKVHAGKIEKFRIHWRDDPRKDDAWYQKQLDELDAVIVAQEIDIDYAASAVGVLIQSAWVQSAIDAHVKLGIQITGQRIGAMDVADGGPDANSFGCRHGILVEHATSWKGGRDEEGDIFRSVERSFALADEWGVDEWYYDADGMGAGVRGDARVINEKRKRKQTVKPFRGSGELFQPEKQIETASIMTAGERDKIERKNEDYFHNMKAQAWYSLMLRFMRTHRAVQLVAAGQPNPYDPDDLISISSEIPELGQLSGELVQPTRTTKDTGKMIIDKAPDGTKSPNLADMIMILFAPRRYGSWIDAYSKRAA